MKLQIAFYIVSVYSAVLTGAAIMLYVNMTQTLSVMQ